MKEKHIIECPGCGCQYTPAEIYLPNEFFNTAEQIVKDETNKILFPETLIQREETYICDVCGTKFKTTAKVVFDTKVVEDKSKSPYTTILKKELFLSEE